MAPDTCYFDARCGLCRRSHRLLVALDWFGRLRFRDANCAEDLPVAGEVALRGMTLRTARGRVLIGFPAIRRALSRTPLGLPLALALSVPGLSGVGRRLYERIAERRGRDSRPGPTARPNANRTPV